MSDDDIRVPLENHIIYHHLYRLEIETRRVVHYILKALYGKQWASSLPPEMKARMRQEKRYGRLIYSPTLSLISYLDFGELQRLIVDNDNIWANFISPWSPPRKTLLEYFNQVAILRRKVAHARPCTEDDVRLFCESGGHVRKVMEGVVYAACFSRQKLEKPTKWYHRLHGYIDADRSVYCEVRENRWDVLFTLTLDRMVGKWNLPRVVKNLVKEESNFTFLGLSSTNLNRISIVIPRKIGGTAMKGFWSRFRRILNDAFFTESTDMREEEMSSLGDFTADGPHAPEFCLWRGHPFIDDPEAKEDREFLHNMEEELKKVLEILKKGPPPEEP